MPLEPIISNGDSLFDNLPPLTEQQMRSTNRMRMPKELNLHVKMDKLVRRQQQMETYKADLEHKMLLHTEHQAKVEQELNDAIFSYKNQYSQEMRQAPRQVQVQPNENMEEEKREVTPVRGRKRNMTPRRVQKQQKSSARSKTSTSPSEKLKKLNFD